MQYPNTPVYMENFTYITEPQVPTIEQKDQ